MNWFGYEDTLGGCIASVVAMALCASVLIGIRDHLILPYWKEWLIGIPTIYSVYFIWRKI